MGLLTNILFIIGAFVLGIGGGIFYGWCFWASEAKYYKNLSKVYKDKLTSPEVKEAILEKRVKNVVNKICKNHKGI